MNQKKSMTIRLVPFFFLTFIFLASLPSGVKAQSIQEYLQIIADLQAQVEELQRILDDRKQEQARKEIDNIPDDFEQNLYFGLIDDGEVKRLQVFLINEGYLGPGLNTGNFLSLTRSALINFQENSGLPATGYFGPMTRALINDKFNRKKEELARFIVTEKPEAIEDLGIKDYKIRPKPVYDFEILEKNIQDLINEKRIKEGVGVLLWNNSIASVAREHSENQARDNKFLTDPLIPCHYPLIRHDGFEFGFKAGDRLKNKGIEYKSAGENIAMLSFSKNLLYQYFVHEPPIECPEVDNLKPGEGTEEERKVLYQETLDKSIEAVQGIFPVNWVNKDWITTEEITKRTVDMWLASPGHRENMLQSRFTEGGIGIAEVNDYVIVTHKMISR